MARSERADGKILNPQTGNWVTQQYAKNIGIYHEAVEATEEHFSDQLKEDADEGEIEDLLSQIDGQDLDDEFDVSEDDYIDVDPPDMEEDFEPKFSRPPTPPGMGETSQKSQSQDSGRRAGGIYTGGSEGPTHEKKVTSRDRNPNRKVKYVRSENGGMKVVRPGDPEYDEA
jgi:hypothetical protein